MNDQVVNNKDQQYMDNVRNHGLAAAKKVLNALNTTFDVSISETNPDYNTIIFNIKSGPFDQVNKSIDVLTKYYTNFYITRKRVGITADNMIEDRIEREIIVGQILDIIREAYFAQDLRSYSKSNYDAIRKLKQP